MRLTPARFVSHHGVSETGTGRGNPKVMNAEDKPLMLPYAQRWAKAFPADRSIQSLLLELSWAEGQQAAAPRARF